MIGAVDIGGTKIAVGIVDPEGKLLSRFESATQADGPYESALDRTATMLRAAMAMAMGVQNYFPCNQRNQQRRARRYQQTGGKQIKATLPGSRHYAAARRGQKSRHAYHQRMAHGKARRKVHHSAPACASGGDCRDGGQVVRSQAVQHTSARANKIAGRKPANPIALRTHATAHAGERNSHGRCTIPRA